MTKKELLEALSHVPEDCVLELHVHDIDLGIICGDAFDVVYDKMNNVAIITNEVKFVKVIEE